MKLRKVYAMFLAEVRHLDYSDIAYEIVKLVKHIIDVMGDELNADEFLNILLDYLTEFRQGRNLS